MTIRKPIMGRCSLKLDDTRADEHQRVVALSVKQDVAASKYGTVALPTDLNREPIHDVFERLQHFMPYLMQVSESKGSMPSTPGPLLTTQPKARATFDSLPLKVRKRIYAYDLSGALPKLSSVGKPALLGTCRDVDSEALQIPSGSHVSQTSIPSRVVRWLHSLASEERAGLEQVFISTRRLRIAALVDSVLGNGCGAPGRIAAVEQTLASVDCTLPSGVVHIPCYDGRIYTWTNIYGDVVLWQDGCRWMRSIRDGHSSVHEEGMGALTDVAGAGRS